MELEQKVGLVYKRVSNETGCRPHLMCASGFKASCALTTPFISCCGEADGYEADLFEQDGENFVAIITGQGTGDLWQALHRRGQPHKSPKNEK